MAIEIFNRYEVKYLISKETQHRLIEELSNQTYVDPYGDDNGKYTITSLYFDSRDSRIYYETINRLPFRQKLRLRCYSTSDKDEKFFFEIKQKFRGRVHKRRTVVDLNEVYQYLRLAPDFNSARVRTELLHVSSQDYIKQMKVSNLQIMKEIDTFYQKYNLLPQVIVSYDRQALQGSNEQDLRITFDSNLRCRMHDLQVECGPNGLHFVDPDLVIMEVKVNMAVPLWLTQVLDRIGCTKRSVSKFCTSIDVAKGEAEWASY